MTMEELEEHFVLANKVVDGMLADWKSRKFTRGNIFVSVLDATKVANHGVTMTALCFTVMAERLMKEMKDEQKGTK